MTSVVNQAQEIVAASEDAPDYEAKRVSSWMPARPSKPNAATGR